MGKALYSPQRIADPRLLAELAFLRARVRELEAEVALLRESASVLADEGLDRLLVTDPALV